MNNKEFRCQKCGEELTIDHEYIDDLFDRTVIFIVPCNCTAEQSEQRTADSGDQLPAEEVVKNYNKAVAKSFRRR